MSREEDLRAADDAKSFWERFERSDLRQGFREHLEKRFEEKLLSVLSAKQEDLPCLQGELKELYELVRWPDDALSLSKQLVQGILDQIEQGRREVERERAYRSQRTAGWIPPNRVG
jgi:hypothetical protein